MSEIEELYKSKKDNTNKYMHIAKSKISALLLSVEIIKPDQQTLSDLLIFFLKRYI